MGKEIYLYSGMYDFTVQELMQEIDECMGEEVTMRVNSPGGYVSSTWGLCAKMQEHGNVTVRVDGTAMSSAFNLTMYAKKVVCLDVSTFGIHRADGYAETDEEKKYLNKINTDLRAKMESRINSEVFKKIAGYTLDEIFNPETRITVFLDAKQAKKIGLVDEIVKLNTEQIKAEFNSFYNIAATVESKPEKHTQTVIITEKNKKMDKNILKAEHSEVYAAILAEGAQQERDRVGAWMAWNDVDPEVVSKGIKEGAELTLTLTAEFGRKALAKGALAKVEGDNPKDITTDPSDVTAETDAEKQLAAFTAKVKEGLNIKG